MRLSSEALAEAHSLAPRIHRSAVADATVAVRLLRAGFEGAHVTVDANLDGVVDADYVRTVREECGRLCERAARGSEEAERLLRV
jgi:formiminotetrahydrofolate cyclodeaminase